MEKRLEIHWEYGRDYWVALRGPELSTELRQDLQAWNDELANFPWDQPRYKPPPSRIDELSMRGRALAVRARDELGPGWTVEYDDLVLGRLEKLPQESVHPSKRHHRN